MSRAHSRPQLDIGLTKFTPPLSCVQLSTSRHLARELPTLHRTYYNKNSINKQLINNCIKDPSVDVIRIILKAE